MIGWIKLHRQIQEHWIHKKPEYFHAWITILLNVNHEKKKLIIDNELIECNRGQSLNSIQGWARILGPSWTSRKVRTFFKLLEGDDMIKTEGMRKTTRLSVCNYDSYQTLRQADDEQATSRRQADDEEMTTNKNGKNYKNEENEELPAHIDQSLFNDFLKLRESNRMVNTDGSVKILIESLNDIEKAKKGQANKEIKRSILNGWKSFFLPDDLKAKTIRGMW